MSEATDPLIEPIAQAVLAKLGDVTTDNGCLVTLHRPIRPKGRWKGGVPDYQTFLEQKAFGRLEEGDDVAGNTWGVVFDITVLLNVPDEPKEDEASDLLPLDQQLNRIWAAVVKATQETPKWGLDSYVLDTEMQDPVFLTSFDGALVGVSVMVLVTYEHKWGDPTSPVA